MNRAVRRSATRTHRGSWKTTVGIPAPLGRGGGQRDELAKLGKPSRAQYTTDVIEYDFNDNIARAMLSCEFEKRLKTVFADNNMKFFCNQIKIEAGYDQLLCLEEAIRVIKVATGR